MTFYVLRLCACKCSTIHPVHAHKHLQTHSLSCVLLPFPLSKGGAIVLSSEDEHGGAMTLINSTFMHCKAASETGGVAYLNDFTSLNVSGDLNRWELRKGGSRIAALARCDRRGRLRDVTLFLQNVDVGKENTKSEDDSSRPQRTG